MLLRGAAHACLEVIRPAVVDFPDEWAAHARDAATGAGGCHGHGSNARYALVKSTVFFFFSSSFGPRIIAGFLLNHLKMSMNEEGSLAWYNITVMLA